MPLPRFRFTVSAQLLVAVYIYRINRSLIAQMIQVQSNLIISELPANSSIECLMVYRVWILELEDPGARTRSLVEVSVVSSYCRALPL